MGEALSIFQKPGIFDGTFVSSIVAEDASLNAKQEERLKWHAESAIINIGLNSINLLTEALNEKGNGDKGLKKR